MKKSALHIWVAASKPPSAEIEGAARISLRLVLIYNHRRHV
jgi:hypothetical protein